ncbi:MAG: peptidyl-prolyl cis-trans isomerase [Deltaproteobacteria bacterium]|nr:peptidyl-prolyl cis-trans isomerase [Deltaproteobacteria bacterium]
MTNKINKIECRKINFLILMFFLALISSPTIVSAQLVDRIVAVVNGGIITLSELKEAEEGVQIEQKLSKEKLRAKALDILIENLLMKQAADKAGIVIGDKELDAAIEDVKKQNNFTDEVFMVALAQNGHDLISYRAQLREEIREAKFINMEFRSKVRLSSSEIREYYEQNIDKYQGAKAYRIRIIFFKASSDEASVKKKVEVVLGELGRGVAFEELARDYSEGPATNNGGDLGFLEVDELDQTVASVAEKLKKGEISGPVTTERGISIIQLVEKKEASPRPLAKVRKSVTEELSKIRLAERFDFWLEETRRTAHIDIRF